MSQPSLTLLFEFFTARGEVCNECEEPLDTDRQSIAMTIDDSPLPLLLHQVCAWKRATFAFGEIF